MKAEPAAVSGGNVVQSAVLAAVTEQTKAVNAAAKRLAAIAPASFRTDADTINRYRLDAGAHGGALAAAATAAERLGVQEPVTLHQARQGTAAQGNAEVVSLPGEVHVMLASVCTAHKTMAPRPAASSTVSFSAADASGAEISTSAPGTPTMPACQRLHSRTSFFHRTTHFSLERAGGG